VYLLEIMNEKKFWESLQKSQISYQDTQQSRINKNLKNKEFFKK